MTRGGKRPGAGRPKTKGEKRTGLLTARIPPTALAEAKWAARTIGMSWTDFVFSAVYEKTQEVRALPGDEKKRRRKIETLREKMFAAIDRGDDATADRLDAELDAIEGDDVV